MLNVEDNSSSANELSNTKDAFLGGTFMGAALKHDELVQVWESIKATNLTTDVIKGIASKFHLSEKVAEASMSVLKKVAACGSFDDFKNYVESNELPALKLTSSEMESVKGGMSVPILKDIIKGGNGPYIPIQKTGF